MQKHTLLRRRSFLVPTLHSPHTVVSIRVSCETSFDFRNNRNWNRNRSFGTIRNKLFVSVVSIQARNTDTHRNKPLPKPSFGSFRFIPKIIFVTVDSRTPQSLSSRVDFANIQKSTAPHTEIPQTVSELSSCNPSRYWELGRKSFAGRCKYYCAQGVGSRVQRL